MRGPGNWARALAVALVVAATPALASAAPRDFDTSDGLVDPRRKPLPRTHRLRLGVEANVVTLTAAAAMNGQVEQFYWAPLRLSLAYQAQFLQLLSVRIGASAGPNVANSRYAMPLAMGPHGLVGVQGRTVGFMAGYSYLGTGHPLLTVRNGTDGRARSLGGPRLWRNHVVLAELSVLSRIDRVRMQFAVSGGGMRSFLEHYQRPVRPEWRFFMQFSAAVYFDGSLRRAKRDAARR